MTVSLSNDGLLDVDVLPSPSSRLMTKLMAHWTFGEHLSKKSGVDEASSDVLLSSSSTLSYVYLTYRGELVQIRRMLP